MNLDELLPLLGRSVVDSQLNSFLSVLSDGLVRGLALPSGEYRTYYENRSDGYSLVFTDEAMFLGREDQGIGTGSLYLSGIFLYSEGKDDYSEYAGSMPNGIRFDATQSDIAKVLGEASWSRERRDKSIAAERWDTFFDYRLHITYSKNTCCPVVVSLNIADKPSSRV
ncbi:hypothetical protein [Agaribacterium sp. ZY112]|uniref:hypothetical protein n=1 Tax=Agaribacterium sp. ZY112 TaxID=3233574 RepID=UPI0035249E6C